MDYPNYVTWDDGSAVRTALHSGASVIPDGSVRHGVGETHVRPTAIQLRPNPNKQSRYGFQEGNEALSYFSS